MNIITLVRSYVFLICLTLLPSCSHRCSTEKGKKQETTIEDALNDTGITVNEAFKDSTPWITVWVHGTQLSFDKAPGSRLRALLKQKALDYVYCRPGIHHISTHSKTNRYCRLAQLLFQSDPLRFPLEHFYTFGWSGDLNFQVRQEAGRTLYQELTKLIDTIATQYGTKPYVRLITHSHGGNVALNLAHAEVEFKKNLSINELVLLACPVQEKTALLVKDPIFKKVYSLYSSLDVLQVVDPQGFYKSNKIKTSLFSKRRFPVSCDTVAQAKIRFDKRAILHIEFLSNRFVRALPHIIAKLELWHQANIGDTRIKQINIQNNNASQASDLVCSYAFCRKNRGV